MVASSTLRSVLPKTLPAPEFVLAILVRPHGDILGTDAQGEIRPNSVAGTAPRRPLVGPGLSAADFTFSKSFRTRERDRIEFRFEAFNALNTPRFGNPGSTVGSMNFGRITGTKVYNREKQAALKYQF